MNPKTKPNDVASTAEEEPAPTRQEKSALQIAIDEHTDFGDWEFRPWSGIPHWVHKTSGASTFDLTKIDA